MTSTFRMFCAAVVAWVFACFALAGSPPTALAQLGPEGAQVEDAGGTVVLTVPLSQPVPWRVRMVDGPLRVVVEFGDVVWSKAPEVRSDSILEASTGKVAAGRSELALALREPLSVSSAEMLALVDGTAILEVRMLPTTADEFRKRALEQEDAAKAEAAARAAEPDDTRMVVAIDPGHGGVDPGAVAGDVVEADLVLAVARRLKEALLRAGRFDVVLTRDEDVFVSLETRLTRARSAGADVFLSLHADALEETDGAASGITVYRLADDAAEAADEILASRHAADDLLKGVDLTGAGDDVALALLDMARRDTAPRTRLLQHLLVEAFRVGELHVNSHPERQGALSVLKAAEIPSVLIELGFLSSEKDRARLTAGAWQDEAAQAVTEALMRWQDEDRLRLEALRQ